MIQNAQPVAIDLLLETGGGGAGRHVLDLHRELRRLGWKSTLLVSRVRADGLFLAELDGLPSDEVCDISMRRSPHPSDIPAISQLKKRFAASKERRILHAHSTKAGMLGWAVGDAVDGKVLTPHAYRGMDTTLSKRSAFMIRALEATYSRAFGKVIAVSPDEQHYIVDSLRIPRERVSYIPNGVDKSSIYSRVNPSASARQEHETPVVGFVGRLVYQKNPSLFIEAFKVLAERGVQARALIVGSGELREGLTRLAEEYNLVDRITWAGDVSALDELGRMDVFLHTSHYESLPYTLLEAVAAEIPIVATENSGSKAIFGELLPSAIVAEANPHTIADAVTALLLPGPARERHIESMRAVSQEFTIQKMVQSTIAVYEELLTKSTRKVSR